MKKIIITRDDKGNMVVNFDGFSGDDCLREAERLAEKIRKKGVHINVQECIKKTDTEVREKQKEKVKE